jgi:hypothetical protein
MNTPPITLSDGSALFCVHTYGIQLFQHYTSAVVAIDCNRGDRKILSEAAASYCAKFARDVARRAVRLGAVIAQQVRYALDMLCGRGGIVDEPTYRSALAYSLIGRVLIAGLVAPPTPQRSWRFQDGRR